MDLDKASTELLTELSNAENGDIKGAESTRSGSVNGSQSNPSAHSSVTLTVEERLRRARAAEELKQKQRYEAYIESQRQAEAARLKAQELRKKRIEEFQQRAEARRQSVLERRKELEMSTKARLESLQERTRSRDQSDQPLYRRRHADSVSAFSRTTSASQSTTGSARHPNNLMTTSCVVAFGSGVPRSTCTQLSPAALRLQQAFEARIASYLTGRHSGCFLTSYAWPNYQRFIDRDHTSSLHNAPNSVARSKWTKYRTRSLSNQPRVSKQPFDRQHLVLPDSSEPSAAPVSTGKSIVSESRALTVPQQSGVASEASNKVSNTRSSSSSECNKLGRPPTAPISVVNGRPEKKTTAPKSASVASQSVTTSCSSSMFGSSRSNSADRLAKRANEALPAVFKRLASQGTNRTRSNRDDFVKEIIKAPTSKEPQKPPAISKFTSKPSISTVNNAKKSSGVVPKLPGKGMSKSVYVDRTDHKKDFVDQEKSLADVTRSGPPASEAIDIPEPPSNEQVPAPVDINQPVVVISEVTPPVANPSQDTTAPDDDETSATEMPSSAEGLIDLTSELPSDKPDLVETQEQPCAPLTPTTHSGPLQTETRGAGEGGLLSAQEQAIYRAKLSEQRRLAKERREEEQRRLEEERSQRQLQAEAERLAAEQAAREREELLIRQAAEATRKREEEEKARLRELEAERLAELQRAEEERIMRKQRLANIMSRVKTKQNGTTALPPPTHSSVSSPFLLGQNRISVDPRGDTSDSMLVGKQSDPRISSASQLSGSDTSRLDPEASYPVSFSLSAGQSDPDILLTNEKQIEHPRAHHMNGVSPTPDENVSSSQTTTNPNLLRPASSNESSDMGVFNSSQPDAHNSTSSLSNRFSPHSTAADVIQPVAADSMKHQIITPDEVAVSPRFNFASDFGSDTPGKTKSDEHHDVRTDGLPPSPFFTCSGLNEQDKPNADPLTPSVVLSTSTH